MLTPSRVSVGMTAFRATCANSTCALAQALGAQVRDEVRVEHLDHPDAQRPHEDRHDRDRRGEARQHERLEVLAERVAPAPHRQHAQAQREDLDQHDPEPERRQAEPRHGQAAHDVVGQPVLTRGGERRRAAP